MEAGWMKPGACTFRAFRVISETDMHNTRSDPTYDFREAVGQ